MTEPSSAATPRAAVPRTAWLAIVALGVLLRLFYLAALRQTPWFEHLCVDPEYYDAWAQRLAAGDWLGQRTFYMDPLYPYLLAILYRVWGHDLLAARLLNIACSAGSILAIGNLGQRLGGAGAGIAAALGFALYKPEIFHSGEVDKTCLSIFLTALSLACLAAAADNRPRRALAAGVALGLASLTRANLLLTIPLAAVWLAQRTRRPDVALALVCGAALALFPVAARNRVVAGEWVLTTSQAGQNFYIGNGPENPAGAYGELPFVRGNPHFEEPDFRAEAERRSGRTLTAPEVSQYWLDQALTHLRSNPGYAVRVMWRKFSLFWNNFEVPDSNDQYLAANDSLVLRVPLVSFALVTALAAAGVVSGFAQSPLVRGLTGFVGLYCISVTAFFIMSRYRIQVVAALFPLGAIGLGAVIDAIGGRNWPRLARLSVPALIMGLYSLHSIVPFFEGSLPFVQMQLSRLAMVHERAGQVDSALIIRREAIEHCATCPAALDGLINTYMNAGRFDDAEAFLSDFQRRFPEQRRAAEFRAVLAQKREGNPAAEH